MEMRKQVPVWDVWAIPRLPEQCAKSIQILCCWSVKSHEGAQEKENQTNSMHGRHIFSRERGKSATSAPHSTQTGKED